MKQFASEIYAVVCSGRLAEPFSHDMARPSCAPGKFKLAKFKLRHYSTKGEPKLADALGLSETCLRSLSRHEEPSDALCACRRPVTRPLTPRLLQL